MRINSSDEQAVIEGEMKESRQKQDEIEKKVVLWLFGNGQADAALSKSNAFTEGYRFGDKIDSGEIPGVGCSHVGRHPSPSLHKPHPHVSLS